MMLGVADMSGFYPQQENSSGNGARQDHQPPEDINYATDAAGVTKSSEQMALKADMQHQLKKFEKAVDERQRILDDSYNKQKS